MRSASDALSSLISSTLLAFRLPSASVKVCASFPPDAAKDAVSRSFYDGDGALIGALDGEGYLTENVYDKAGRLVETIAYATQTASADWAIGSFNQLRSAAVTAGAESAPSSQVAPPKHSRANMVTAGPAAT